MANAKHIRWLNEGREAWNERRRAGAFLPDLSEARFSYGSDLAGYDLEESDCREAVFVGTVLSGTNLANSNLSGIKAIAALFDDAVLGGSDLTGAELSGCSFENAILQKSNLTGADLSWSNLSGADLRFADVSGAELESAILCRTNTVAARLWQAQLFASPGPTADDAGTVGQEATVHSVAELLEAIGKIENHGKLYFRGEQQCGWDLAPSLFREDLEEHEHEMLNDLMTLRPRDLDQTRTGLGHLQIAQHYGLSTRLLDVTQNPLVALFFACEDDEQQHDEDGRIHVLSFPAELIKPFNSDTVSVIAGFAKLTSWDKIRLLSKDGLHPQRPFSSRYRYEVTMSRLLEIIRQEKSHFEDRIDMKDLHGVFVVEPQHHDERVVAQSAAFLISAFRERFDYPEGEEWNNGLRPYGHHMLRIASDSKARILRELELMRIMRQTLFPGLETAAAAVMRRHREQSPRPSHT